MKDKIRTALKSSLTSILMLSFLSGTPKAFADDFWSYWGDGKAELSGYKLVQPRYGQKRNGKAVLIFVTETHSEKEKVKIEGDHTGVPSRDRFSVMKLNDVRMFQTGIYDYRVTASVFSRVDRKFELSKVSLGVQEWCGHVYHQLVSSGKQVQETLHSYFGGEDDQNRGHAIPPGAVFEDNIPILIRELRGPWLKPGEKVEFAGAPSLLALRFQHKPFSWGKISVHKSALTGNISTVLGERKAVRWTVSTPLHGTYTCFVEADPPHRILKWTSDQGESGELTGTIRLDYWKLHDEGDESYLKKLFPK